MLSKNKLPAAEGIIRFTNQITAMVTTMPKASGVINPNNCLPASPLIPTSAKGIVGKIANNKNKTTGNILFRLFTLVGCALPSGDGQID